jgi:hypothetical protein
MDGKERRRFPRLAVEVNIAFSVLSNLSEEKIDHLNNQIFENKTRDISPIGMCIKTGLMVPPDSIIDIKIAFPGTTVRGLARVVWSADIERDGVFYSGVEFIAIKDSHLDSFSQSLAAYYVDHFKGDKEKGKCLIMDFLRKFFKKE